MNLQPCLMFASERLPSPVVWEMDCFIEAACLIVCNPARRRPPQAPDYGGSRSSLSDSSEGERSSKKGEDVGAKAPSFQVFDSRWSCVLSSSLQRRAVLCVHVMRAKLVAEGKHFWALVSLFLISITMTLPPMLDFILLVLHLKSWWSAFLVWDWELGSELGFVFTRKPLLYGGCCDSFL